MTIISSEKDVQAYNSFGISAQSAGVISFDTIESLQQIIKKIDKPYVILGGGSNVLFTQDIDQYILINNIKGIEVTHLNEEEMLLHTGSGVLWDDVVAYAVNCGLGGIENLSWIPGKAGAAPMQNIGAYGVEIKDVFHSLEALNLETLEQETFYAQDCLFAYRESVFKNKLKGKYCILKLRLKLRKNPILNTSYGAIAKTLEERGIKTPTVKDLREVVVDIRKAKLPDPNEIGNAGSFFKNPILSAEKFDELKTQFPDIPSYPLENGIVKVPAGWLIDQAGWKGKRIGNTGCYKNQALVIVNHGGALGSEVWQHALNVQQSVLDKYGVKIEPEVNVL